MCSSCSRGRRSGSSTLCAVNSAGGGDGVGPLMGRRAKTSPGAKNYACPSCGKGFAKMQGMLSHIEQRPQCQPADSQRALTFAY